MGFDVLSVEVRHPCFTILIEVIPSGRFLAWTGSIASKTGQMGANVAMSVQGGVRVHVLRW